MAILTADELASVRREYRAASLLPARTYQDPAVLDWEREHILQRDWLAVGRAEEVPEPGSFLVRDVLGESVLLVRGRDDEIRAFYNVCRHRGTAVEERECGKAVRFQCPYHAWIYELDGSLVRAKHTEDLDDFSLDTYGLRAHPVRDLAGLRVPVLRRRVGDRGARDAARRPRRQHGPLRLHLAPVGEADRVRGRRRTGS